MEGNKAVTATQASAGDMTRGLRAKLEDPGSSHLESLGRWGACFFVFSFQVDWLMVSPRSGLC